MRARSLMQPIRSQVVVAVAACMVLSSVDSIAQAYPAKPIRVVVGYTPGGAADFSARWIAQKLSEQSGQSAVVENRAGASGTIATERVAASPADGYTLLVVTASDTVQPALRAKLPYDLERDFTPVSLVCVGAFVLMAHPSLPVKSVRDLIALAKARPRQLSYASAGSGSTTHLAAELFKSLAGVDILHVPYKGGGPATVDLMAGEVQIYFGSVPAAMAHVKSGRIRSLAVTSEKRVSLLPSLPTIAEAGLPGYAISAWYGVIVPAGTPRDVVARLSAMLAKAVNAPEAKDAFAAQGFEPRHTTPEQFAAYIRGEMEKNAKLVRSGAVKGE